MLLLLVFVPLHAVEDNGNYNNNSDPGSSIPNWTTGWPGAGADGWNYVGQVNGASGTYLGDGWVITAAHVGAGNFILNGVTYNPVSGTTTSINGGTVDIVLFQVMSPPSLSPLPLAQSAPIPFTGGAASAVAMIGYGGGFGETWGFNTVNGVNDSFQLSGRTSIDFYTTNGTTTIGTQSVTNNARLISGDSGGGDFIFNASTGRWELAGINEATGGASYFVQISAYLQQILNITGLTAPPVITAGPANGSVYAGTSLTLSVSANGSTPFSYQWSENGAAISGATTATFTLESPALSDSGTYTVAVSNSYGSVSSSAQVAVLPQTVSPLPATQIATIGQPTSFSASVQGTGPFTYQWLFNGAAISGATNNPYTISSVTEVDAGDYSVEVSNAYGAVTSSASELAPVISQQTILAGQSANFTISPTGEGPFTYQWQFNGEDLSGATGQAYTVTNAQPGQSGLYTVLVTSASGSTSSSFSLLVNPLSSVEETPAMPEWSLALLALLLAGSGVHGRGTGAQSFHFTVFHQ